MKKDNTKGKLLSFVWYVYIHLLISLEVWSKPHAIHHFNQSTSSCHVKLFTLRLNLFLLLVSGLIRIHTSSFITYSHHIFSVWSGSYCQVGTEIKPIQNWSMKLRDEAAYKVSFFLCYNSNSKNCYS